MKMNRTEPVSMPSESPVEKTISNWVPSMFTLGPRVEDSQLAYLI